MNRARGPLRNGFTLLEILIALTILAVALSAAMRVAGGSTNIVSEQKQRTLALWVAQNRLAEHRARGDWPDMGVSEGEIEQAGIKMRWQETVSGTPRSDFRRIEVLVFGAGSKDYALAELTGFLVQGE